MPDVAGNADPETGYEVLVDGKRTVIGGTSAVAPLWAALVARLAQALGPAARTAAAEAVRAQQPASGTSRSGATAPTPARAGWDACTGLGVPQGAALLAALREQASPTAEAV